MSKISFKNVSPKNAIACAMLLISCNFTEPKSLELNPPETANQSVVPHHELHIYLGNAKDETKLVEGSNSTFLTSVDSIAPFLSSFASVHGDSTLIVLHTKTNTPFKEIVAITNMTSEHHINMVFADKNIK